MQRRVTHTPAYVLHRRPWSESSFVVELLSRDYGRMGVLAKGARRLKSPFRGLLEPFQELSVSWSGKGDLPVLTAAEFRSRQGLLYGNRLYSGFYVNELLLRLLARRDPVTELYNSYDSALTRLRQPENRMDGLLRQFEMELLGHLGYGLNLTGDPNTQTQIEAGRSYDYVSDQGPIERQRIPGVADGPSQAPYDTPRQYPARDESDAGGVGNVKQPGKAVPVSGRTLLAMRSGEFSDRQVLNESKQLLREQLQVILDGRVLQSRRLLHGVRERLADERRRADQSRST